MTKIKFPPDRREMCAATAEPSLRILSWTGTHKATSGSPHTGAKKSRSLLRNCSDLFAFAACTVFVAVAGYSAICVLVVSDFPMAFSEKLIELVKIYPILYDLSHKDYKNVRKKDKVWEQIGVELKESGKWFCFIY